MAKKKNQPARPAATPAKPVAAAKTQPVTTRKPQPGNSKGAAGNDSFLKRYANILIPAAIGLLTFICYRACFDNKLTNWDDLGYIITDPLIKSHSPENIRRILGFDGIQQACVMGNYHPLTILLYMIEYSYYGLEPWIYHFDSVLLHVAITIAVFYFIKVFTGRTVAAAVVALLFGVHPMHVESVAWGAGRKDILYGIFFILTCTTYVLYIRNTGGKKIMWYVLGVVLFALSLFAKSVAVTLPVTLFLIDFFENRISFEGWKPLFNFNAAIRTPGATTTPRGNDILMLIAEKVPHFALAFLFGILSVQAQKNVGALGSLDANFTPLERGALGCYALWGYLWKAVLPLGMCNFYPYPLKIGDALPYSYYAYPLIIIGILFAIWRFGRKNKAVIFGCGFFLINIILLLQFIPVGGAIMSDRYGYIPYLGLFFIAGWFVSDYFERPAGIPTGKILLGIVIGYSLVLGFMTSQRCKDWYDSISLWKDDAEKHPEAPVSYFYLGQEYFTRYEASANATEKKMLGDSSLYYFNMSIARKPDYINPIICVAELQRNYGLFDDARQTYYRAIKIDSNNESIYLGLGVIYTIKKQYDSASYAFQKAIHKKAYYPEGHSNYANFLDITGKLDSSLIEYGYSISQNPDAYIPYMNRARIYMVEKKEFDKAIADYNHAIALKPDNGEPYYLRSKCYFLLNNKAQALKDVETAKSKGFDKIAPDYYQQLTH